MTQTKQTVAAERFVLVVRLLKGGGPALLAGGVSLLTPLLGLLYLESETYVVWALASTLVTIFLVLDFGTGSLSVSLASQNQAYPRALLKLCAITSAPPIMLSGLAIAIWPWYAVHADVSIKFQDVAVLFILLAAGTVFRGVGLVVAGVALGKSRFVLRSWIYLSGALTQLAVVFTLLKFHQGVLALGVGILLGGAVQMAIALAKMPTIVDRAADETAKIDGVIWQFAKSKGLVAAIGLSIMQLDRWALGLSGSPSNLQVYDAITRLGSIPKVALVALLAGLIKEMTDSSLKSAHALRGIYTKSMVITTAVSVIGAACALVGGLLLGLISDSTTFLIVALVICAQTASALTIPITMYLATIRRPALELLYLIPMAAVVYVAFAYGVAAQNSIALIVGSTIAIIFSSVIYTAIGSSRLLKGGWHVN